MSDQIRQYFERYAENGLAQVKRSLVAIPFYDDVRKRLVRGEDLSQELEGIKLAGPDKTLQVVLETIEEYKDQIKGMIMIAKITPADKIPIPTGGPLTNGPKRGTPFKSF